MPFRGDDGREFYARQQHTQAARHNWLRKIFLDDLLLKLLALALTLGLWYGLTGQRAPATIRLPGIQLAFRLPYDMEISNDPRGEIAATFAGSRQALDRINARDLIAYVDISDRKPGERVIRLTPESVRLELPDGVRLTRVEPLSVPLRLEPRVQREVIVTPRFEGKLPEGYELRAVHIIPNRVRVRGAASHVNALEQALTESIQLDSLRDTTILSQVALDIDDPKINALDATVSVQLEIAKADNKP
jgi:YbbR domain-containing protein